MKEIKTKNKIKTSIKTLDKTKLWTQRIKNPILNLNEKSKENTSQNNNITDYGDEKIKLVSNRMKNEAIHVLKNNTPKVGKTAIKKGKKAIRTTEKTIKKSAKVSKKALERGRKLAIETSKKSIKTAKVIIRLTVKSIKGIIIATKSLISLISAGGVVAAVIIILIALIGLICFSCFGIFFSNEGSSTTISNVVSETNKELYNEIEKQKRIYISDDYEIEYNTNNWREVLAIYSVKYGDGNSKEPVLYLNEDNVSKVRQVYWDMNEITTRIVTEDRESETLSNNNYVTIVQPKKVLYISINNKTSEQIMNEYHFSENQKKQVAELLSEKYNSLWNNLLYGKSENNKIINVAIQEIGNIHGEKYWRWYGFNSRVAWCAIFVSWVADQAGYLNVNIPKFSVVGDGARWYKERGQWEGKDYVPKSGDLIFFDWEQDKKLNHVGIVEKVEANYVYVIEGNSNDQCKENKYSIDDNRIAGYGVA